MQTEIFVHNIKCGGCANSIKSKLEKMNGISDITVEVEHGKILFNSETSTQIAAVKEVLKKMGYPEGDPTVLESSKSYVSCMIGRMKD